MNESQILDLSAAVSPTFPNATAHLCKPLGCGNRRDHVMPQPQGSARCFSMTTAPFFLALIGESLGLFRSSVCLIKDSHML